MTTLKSGSTNRIKGELTALAVVRHREAGWTGSSGALRERASARLYWSWRIPVHFATRNPDEELSILVHEMVHPSSRAAAKGYPDRQWGPPKCGRSGTS